MADRRVIAGPSVNEINRLVTSKTHIPVTEDDGQAEHATQNIKVNPANWQKFLDAQDYSSNIEDRRTPDDMTYIGLRDRFLDVSDKNKLSKSEETWMQHYYMLMQVKNRQGLDQWNEERGLLKKPGDRYYKKQPNPHPRD